MTDLDVRRLLRRDADRLNPRLACDFLVGSNASAMDPFLATSIGGGTINVPSVIAANHPGSTRIRNGTTSADSGYYIGTNTAQIRLAGGERFESIFLLDTLVNNTFRTGFMDTTTVADAVDGCYLEILATGVATGKTANNSVRSNTATTTTLVVATWYHLVIQLSSDASSVTFMIYDDSGVVIWTDSLTTNIPTAAGRELGAGFVATNSMLIAGDLAHLDYMVVEWKRRLTRGGA